MIHFLKEQGTIDDATAKLVETEIDAALKLIASRLPYRPIDIVVADNKSMVIPEHGVGGYTSTAHELYIPLDMSRVDIHDCIRQHLRATMAHELGHVARLQHGLPLGGGTLADSVVGEGLADHFSLALYPEQDIPWTHALSKEKLVTMFGKFEEEKNDTHFDHHGWFFGAEYMGVPRWAGYTLGFELIRTYLDKYPEKTIFDILLAPTSDILPLPKA